MARPRSVDDWSAVRTAQDFRAFLSVLAYDLAWSARAWRNRRIPDYLHGWARWLHATSLDPGSPARGEVEPPTWRGLAFQLREARFGEGPGAARLAPVGDWTEVVTADDFAGFLVWLGDDYRRDQAELARRAGRGRWAAELDWTSADLGAFLDAWAACGVPASRRDGRPRARGQGAEALALDPLTWRSCAAQLFMASRYEWPRTVRRPEPWRCLPGPWSRYRVASRRMRLATARARNRSGVGRLPVSPARRWATIAAPK